MATIDDAAVLAVLGQVAAPGAASPGHKAASGPTDIASLGFVKDLAASSAGIKLRVEFPAPLTPARRAVETVSKAALSKAFPGVPVEVTIEGRIPSAFVGGEGTGPKKKVLASGVKNFIAVGSGKGGVGKSTVAVNLAVGLARAGARVGLLDADVYGPSVPLLTGVTREAFMEEMSMRAAQGQLAAGGGEAPPPQLMAFEALGLKVMSLGFVVEPEKAAIWRGPMVHNALQTLLGEVNWGELDYLVIDLPPGTGDVHLSLAQFVPLTGSVIVCTPQPVALADARKALNLFQSTKTPVLGLVENMSGHSCSKCGHVDDIFGTGGARDAAFEWQIPFLGSIPLSTDVRHSGDRGRPLLADVDRPEDALSTACWGVVDRVTHVLGETVRARPRSLPIRRTP